MSPVMITLSNTTLSISPPQIKTIETKMTQLVDHVIIFIFRVGNFLDLPDTVVSGLEILLRFGASH